MRISTTLMHLNCLCSGSDPDHLICIIRSASSKLSWININVNKESFSSRISRILRNLEHLRVVSLLLLNFWADVCFLLDSGKVLCSIVHAFIGLQTFRIRQHTHCVWTVCHPTFIYNCSHSLTSRERSRSLLQTFGCTSSVPSKRCRGLGAAGFFGRESRSVEFFFQWTKL